MEFCYGKPLKGRLANLTASAGPVSLPDAAEGQDNESHLNAHKLRLYSSQVRYIHSLLLTSDKPLTTQ